jgi:hypothetical protein
MVVDGRSATKKRSGLFSLRLLACLHTYPTSLCQLPSDAFTFLSTRFLFFSSTAGLDFFASSLRTAPHAKKSAKMFRRTEQRTSYRQRCILGHSVSIRVLGVYMAQKGGFAGHGTWLELWIRFICIWKVEICCIYASSLDWCF